jgi:hypothetical protein
VDTAFFGSQKPHDEIESSASSASPDDHPHPTRRRLQHTLDPSDAAAAGAAATAATLPLPLRPMLLLLLQTLLPLPLAAAATATAAAASVAAAAAAPPCCRCSCCSLLPAVCCLLPAACCLLPAACCLPSPRRVSTAFLSCPTLSLTSRSRRVKAAPAPTLRRGKAPGSAAAASFCSATAGSENGHPLMLAQPALATDILRPQAMGKKNQPGHVVSRAVMLANNSMSVNQSSCL